MTGRHVAAATLAGLLLLACGRRAPPETGVEPVGSEVGIRIDNHYWLDVTIQVYHDGVFERLGQARAATTTSWSVPVRKFGTQGVARLMGDPIGSPDTIYTELLTVRPGSLVIWTIENNLGMSSVGVY